MPLLDYQIFANYEKRQLGLLWSWPNYIKSYLKNSFRSVHAP